MPRFLTLERLTWGLVGVLVVSCAVLATLQYRWVGQISAAERDRLRQSLRSRLDEFARSFDNEIATAANALVPSPEEMQRLGREIAWRSRAVPSPLFRRVSLVWHVSESLMNAVQLEPALAESRQLPAGEVLNPADPATLVLEVFGQPLGPEWLILELNPDYLRTSVIPRLLNLYVSEEGTLDYDAEIGTNSAPPRVFYSSGGDGKEIREHADASVPLLNIRLGNFRGPGRGRGFGAGPGSPPDGRRGPPRGSFGRDGPPRGMAGGPPPGGRGGPAGMWLLSVRHHAGSLEALVSRTQWRNLAISGGILLLILGASALLLYSSRQAQRFSDLQMEFVAGVSHELRTPLTVIRTAAYNLRGPGVNGRPDQVEKYGRLIEGESTRLESLMEQVLRFARLKAGQTSGAREPVSLAGLAGEELDLRRKEMQERRIEVDARLDPALPPVLAEPSALRHAIRNLIDNALKHGAAGRWIGVYAIREGTSVELRVADSGPGVPAKEQRRIFQPFHRGSIALREQIHGTGLGLHLVRTIVEAQGGSVAVHSDGVNGAEFIVRLPEYRNEDPNPAG